ncbi:MAG: S8 family serine peptidase, partial [Fimbriimonadaceae bacterium]
MKSTSPILFLAALMALAPSQAIAGQAQEAGHDFFSVPEISEIEGYRFFSGRMNVKIREDQEFAAMGVNPAFVDYLQNRALRMVEKQVVRDFEYIDTLVLDIPDGFNEESYAQRLMATGLFEFVEPDYGYFPAQLSVDDPRYDDQWHLPKIRADFAWEETLATGQKVAVLDTGVDTDHPDLVDQLLEGWDTENDNEDIEDENGHGTHVIGIAAAVTNNATGVAGVAYGAGIVPIDISDLESGTAFESAMTAGVDWVMANHPDCKVINLSYAGGASSTRENTATKFRNAGGLLFNSGGNSNEFYPEGVQPNLVLVGNSTVFDSASFDTAYGPGIDIFAPGSNILSTVVDGNYQAFSGTSMA